MEIEFQMPLMPLPREEKKKKRKEWKNVNWKNVEMNACWNNLIISTFHLAMRAEWRNANRKGWMSVADCEATSIRSRYLPDADDYRFDLFLIFKLELKMFSGGKVSSYLGPKYARNFNFPRHDLLPWTWLWLQISLFFAASGY